MASEFTVQEKKIIAQMRAQHPEYAQYSDAQILTIYNQELSNIRLSKEDSISILRNDSLGGNLDNIQLKSQKQVNISKDREQALLTKLKSRVENIKSETTKAEKNNSVVGHMWSWMKNNIPLLDKITDSSNEVLKQGVNEQKILDEVSNGKKTLQEAFKEITGVDYTEENINKFLDDNTKDEEKIKTKSEQALEAYTEGQEESADFASDMLSGMGSMILYTAGIAAITAFGAPFALAAGVAVGGAALLGAGLKVGLKAADSAAGGKEYKFSWKDVLMGAVNGAVAPLTAGFGGKLAASIVGKLGGTAVKEGTEMVGVNVLADSAATKMAGKGIKAFIKEAMINPMGNIYHGSKKAILTGYAVELGVDGGLSGAVDAGTRTAYDGGDAGDIAGSALGGGIGGVFGGWALGGFMKWFGNRSHKAGAELGDKLKTEKEGEVSARTQEESSVTMADKAPAENSADARTPKTLEGDVKDTDLDEPVYFNGHREESPDNGEIIIPERSNVKLDNGEFDADGNYIQGDTYTLYKKGKMSKGKTYKRDTYGKKHDTTLVTSLKECASTPVARNLKELKIQFENMNKAGLEFDFTIRELENELKRHKDWTVEDISELLIAHANLGSQSLAKKFRFYNLHDVSISSIREYTKKLDILADIMSERNNAVNSKLYEIFRYRGQEILVNVSPEVLKKNMDFLMSLDEHSQKRLLNDYSYLFRAQDEKFYERRLIENEYNAFCDTPHRLNYKWTRSDIDSLSDKEFKAYADALKLVRSILESDEGIHEKFAADILRRYYPEAAEIHTILQKYMKDTELPPHTFEMLTKTFGYYNSATPFKPEYVTAMLEIMKHLPYGANDRIVRNYETMYGNTMVNLRRQIASKIMENKTEIENLIMKAKLMEIIPGSSKYFYGWDDAPEISVYRGLIDTPLIDTAKMETFLRTVDLDDIDTARFYEMLYQRGIDIDIMTKCAEINKDLPASFRRFLAEDEYYKNEKFVDFDRNPEELRAKIDLIKKYEGKLDNRVLADIYKRTEPINEQILDMFIGLPESCTRQALGEMDEEWSKLPPQTLAKIRKTLQGTPDSYEHTCYQFLEIIKDENFLKFHEILTEEELNNLPSGFFFDKNQYFREDYNFNANTAINELKETLNAIPERLRPYFRDGGNSAIYIRELASLITPEKKISQHNVERINWLNSLSDEELDNLGPKVISEYISEKDAFNPQNLKEWQKVPQEIKDKMGKHAYRILISDNVIDTEKLISRIDTITEHNLLEILDGDMFADLLSYNDELYKFTLDILNHERFAEHKTKYTNAVINMIGICAKKFTKEDREFVLSLANNKNFDMQYIASYIERASNTEKCLSKQVKEVTKYLLSREDVSTSQIVDFAYKLKDESLTNTEKFEYLKKLLDNPNLKGQDRVEQAIKACSYLDNNSNIYVHRQEQLIDMMLERDLSIDCMHYLRSYNGSWDDAVNTKKTMELFKFVETLLKTEDLDNDIIINLLEYIQDDIKREMMDKLIFDKELNFPREYIPEIVGVTWWNTKDFAYKLCTDKTLNCPPENIANILYPISTYADEEKCKAMQKFAERLIRKDFPDIPIEEVNNILNVTRDIEFAEKYLAKRKEMGHSIRQARRILATSDPHNKELAEIVCFDKKLDFPPDKIPFLLDCRISSDFAPKFVAQKTKKFIELGFEDDMIRDILENSTSLSFYTDEVLKILKKYKDTDKDIKVRDIIQALMQDAPNDLQDRIDRLVLLNKFTDEEVAVFKKRGVDVNKKMKQLEDLIDHKHPLISTEKEDILAFLKVMSNNPDAEKVIRMADFSQFEEKGIPLQYSREEFIKRMNELSGGALSDIAHDIKDVEIPELKLTEADIAKTKTILETYKRKYKTTELDAFIDGEPVKIIRFVGSKSGENCSGSNPGDFVQIGERLFYMKFPDETKLDQSVEEVMASQLYRAAGIDAANLKLIQDADGKIIGMASEYIPDMVEIEKGPKLFDSFGADAWLADWDAPKHDNSRFKNERCLKMDVGGSMDFRAQGERKDFSGDTVAELVSLIEQNGCYLSMTKSDILASLKHVTDISDDAIWKIVEEVPSAYRSYSLGQKLIRRRDYIKKFVENLEEADETKFGNIVDFMKEICVKTDNEFEKHGDVSSLFGYEQTAYGFEGLLNTRDLSEFELSPHEIATAQRMRREIEKFTKFNKVRTDANMPQPVKEFLNSILRGLPEYAAIFSKPQHRGYSLDIHILKVLQDSMKDPDYDKLSDKDKIVLKFSALLHDIGKRYLGKGNSDTGHATLCAEYVYSILDRYKLDDDTKDRIVSIVNNHHWFKDFCNGVMDPQTIATLARRPQDFLIYKILAKADLVNVSEKHAISCVKGSTSMEDIWPQFARNIENIEKAMRVVEQKQVVVTPTRFVEVNSRVKYNDKYYDGRRFPTETAQIDGVDTDLRVLNLTTISDDEDMFLYGFAAGMKKSDLRLIVHMPGDGSIKRFNVFKTLAKNPLNNSAQSMSMISMADKSTYGSRVFGFVLDVNNANIGHAYPANTNSGTQKGLSHFVREVFEEGKHRDYVRLKFRDFMLDRGITIDGDTYAQLAKYIMSKPYPETQIKDIEINGQIFKAQDILDAFHYSRDMLINEKHEKTHGKHNELVGLNAKVRGLIAKVSSLSECPEYFLRFARDNNLPIILIGE